MSKKHFEAIASVLSAMRSAPVLSDEAGEAGPQVVTDTLNATAEALADVFAGFNGNFNRDRFIAACQK